MKTVGSMSSPMDRKSRLPLLLMLYSDTCSQAHTLQAANNQMSTEQCQRLKSTFNSSISILNLGILTSYLAIFWSGCPPLQCISVCQSATAQAQIPLCVRYLHPDLPPQPPICQNRLALLPLSLTSAEPYFWLMNICLNLSVCVLLPPHLEIKGHGRQGLAVGEVQGELAALIVCHDVPQRVVVFEGLTLLDLVQGE